MKNLSKRELILLSAVLTIGIIYVYVTYFLTPTVKEISSARSNILVYESKLNAIKTANVINKKLKEDLENYKVKLTEATEALPPNERQPEITFGLKAAADNSKISLNSIAFGQTADSGKDKILIVPVSVSINGTYKSVVNFIDSVEKDSRAAVVDNVTISKSGSDQDNVQSSMTVIYYYTSGAEDKNFKYEFNNGNYGKDNLFK